MPLSVQYSLQVLQEIKRINSIKDFGERTDAFIFGKQKAHELINDELDELFSSVILTDRTEYKPTNNDKLISVKEIVDSLSIIYTTEEQYKYEYETLYKFMENYLESLYWYEKELIALYLKLGNYRAIETATGIPFESCYKTIQGVFKKIRIEAEIKFPDIEFNIKKKL